MSFIVGLADASIASSLPDAHVTLDNSNTPYNLNLGAEQWRLMDKYLTKHSVESLVLVVDERRDDDMKLRKVTRNRVTTPYKCSSRVGKRLLIAHCPVPKTVVDGRQGWCLRCSVECWGITLRKGRP